MNKCDMTHLYVNMTHEYVDMTTVTVAVKRCLLFDGRRELITQFISQWSSRRPIFWYSQRARGEGAGGEGRRDYPTTVTVDRLSHVTHVHDSCLVRKRKKMSTRHRPAHIYEFKYICHIFLQMYMSYIYGASCLLGKKQGGTALHEIWRKKKHWVLEMFIREKNALKFTCHIYMEHHVYWGKKKNGNAALLFTKRIHMYTYITFTYEELSGYIRVRRMATR